MNELKPGCKAIVVRGRCPENIGKIVTCLNYIGSSEPVEGLMFGDNDYWEVDKPILFKPKNITLFICSAKTLQRIDDHDQPETIKTEKEVSA